ncbi:hypothetical protein [Spongiactinospora sp. TRM90649]|uniref:DUF7144 family membrane protein n=1 Tax=Spongiactinospora sp. TRM90649 TaxID=3031114 RepID=UPI0023F65E5A|nr:hypothetical protein [Spongiactinospora sp. TRM90649]MDF5756917.1 hypothetical protein [Spongiactinospora sp. TRM90649]
MTTRPYAKRGWSVGFALFAAILMVTVGSFQALEGLAAVIGDQFYLRTPNYIYAIDLTAWGWTHLIIGIVVAVAGWGVLSGRLWARIVGIAAAVLSAIANFFFIPYYPVWAILIIALDVFVIWALCVYGRQEAAEAGLGGD